MAAVRVLFAGWIAVTSCLPVNAAPLMRITEVMSKTHDTDPEPDWFELTNFGTAPYTITGHKVDDGSFDATVAATLQGVTTIAPGGSISLIAS